MPRPVADFVLAPADKATLQGWLRKGSTPNRLAQRARILLSLAERVAPQQISAQHGTSVASVFRWRARYQDLGVAGLKDRPRPGQPRKLTQQKVREILTLTTQRIPAEATHWSLRLMARYTDTTIHQVQQVWQTADLKPHRLQTFKISNDPDFADKVVDVVGLYMNPPANAVVLSVDEKTQIQALDRIQPMLPLRPGQVERRHTTTSATAQQVCTRPSMSSPATSWGASRGATGPANSSTSCVRLTGRPTLRSTCTSSSTTVPRTRQPQ